MLKKLSLSWKIREEILIWMTLLQYFGKSSFHYQALTLKIQKEIKLFRNSTSQDKPRQNIDGT